jgi:hypothetical protein
MAVDEKKRNYSDIIVRVGQDLVPSSGDVLSPQGLKSPVGKMSPWVFVHPRPGRDIDRAPNSLRARLNATAANT